MNGVQAQNGDCEAVAGTLTTAHASVCLPDGGAMIHAEATGDAVVPEGFSTIYVLTQGEGLVVMQTNATPEFTVSELGLFTIHTLVYDPMTLDLSIVDIGVTTGGDVNALLIQGGGTICASLDVTGAAIMVNDPDAGGLTAVTMEVCLEDSMAMLVATADGDMYVPDGYSTTYVLTMGADLVILETAAEPSFTVDMMGTYTIHTLVYDPTTLDLSVVVPGETTGTDVHAMLVQGGGMICASLDVGGAMFHVIDCDVDCPASAGTLVAGDMQVCLEDSMAMLSASLGGGLTVPEGYMSTYVLTMGAELVIMETSVEPSFTVDMMGTYTIHTLVYDPTTLDLSVVVPGVTTGSDVHAMLIQGGGTICASLDVVGAMFHVVDCDVDCPASAGLLIADHLQVCLEDSMAMVSASLGGGLSVPEGYMTKYVLTGTGAVILQVAETPEFSVDMVGGYVIHTLVYDPMTLDLSMVVLGVTTGFDVNEMLIQGGGEICAALDLQGAPVMVVLCDDDCEAYAGGLTATASQVCYEDGMAMIGASPSGGIMVPDGYTSKYVLTGPGMVIQELGDSPSFTVNMTGAYAIHTIVYDPMTLDLSVVVPGVTTASEVHALLIQGGGTICASLDLVGAPVSVIICDDECPAYAGSLVGLKDVFCFIPGGSVIGATVVGDAVVPPGYVIKWVAAHGEDLIIEAIADMAWFNVFGMGMYSIHTLVYNPSSFDISSIQLGVTSANDIHAMLTQGGGSICGSLDLAGVSLIVDSPITPTLTATQGTVCYEDGPTMISATAGLDMNLPMGYSHIYILTEGEAKVIKETSTTMPSFTVDAMGHYTIHTLVYDPMTFPLEQFTPGVSTAYDVNALLIQGGGIYCAALDMIGATVHVVICDDECPAWAGSLASLKNIFCYTPGGSVIGATVVGDAVVPSGYEIKWVATSGADLIIEAVGDMAWFNVPGMGLYTIHTLVYDPSTLDLSTVQLGVTSAYDVHAMLIQGGGEICASLDIGGVSMYIDDPTPPTLTAVQSTVCFTGGSEVIGANVAGDMNLPMGYVPLYILTKGPSMLIKDTSSVPSFEVDEIGHYTIHTLLYDPFTFPLQQFTVGTSTAYDINSLLIQGGGIYCAALDVDGASVHVMDCNGVECLAHAGTVSADDMELCFVEGGLSITAEADGNMVVPAGYMTKYVLTMAPGNTIVQLGDELDFMVTEPGHYVFHTLVYDPSTLDLSTLTLGMTTAGYVNSLLVQGGGMICASLDLTGAATHVMDCTIDCPAMAGMLVPDTADHCLMEGSAMLMATASGDMYVPEGYSVTYLLSSGLTPVIHEYGTSPSFTVMSADIWRIHTLVYDSTTFDPSMEITMGMTTIMELNAMLMQGGGSICASLDILGALFAVIDCEDCLAFAGTLTADTVEICLTDSMVMLSATAAGDAVIPAGFASIYVLTEAGTYTIVDVAETPSLWVDLEGQYTIHTLVYDPLTLNLGFVVPGETTALDVLAYIEMNQAMVCANLDLTGITFSVVDCDEGITITNAWPVPATDLLTVQLNVPTTSPTDMVVIDVNGAQVMPSRAIGTGTNQVVLNVAGLGAGFYMIRMLSNDKVATYNFIKGN